MELWTSRYVKNDTTGCGNIFHYRPAHSENLYFFVIFVTQIDPCPILSLSPSWPRASWEPWQARGRSGAKNL